MASKKVALSLVPNLLGLPCSGLVSDELAVESLEGGRSILAYFMRERSGAISARHRVYGWIEVICKHYITGL